MNREQKIEAVLRMFQGGYTSEQAWEELAAAVVDKIEDGGAQGIAEWISSDAEPDNASHTRLIIQSGGSCFNTKFMTSDGKEIRGVTKAEWSIEQGDWANAVIHFENVAVRISQEISDPQEFEEEVLKR